MRRTLLAGVGLLLLGGLLVLLPLRVSAHALLQSSDPPAGASLAQSPTAVTITFGEQPDAHLSRIQVLDVDGRSVDRGDTTVVDGSPLQLRVDVMPLPRGVYTVSWRTVSAVDQHSAAGTYAFGVQVSPPTAAADTGSTTGTSTLAVGTVIGRALLFMGLILMLGCAVVAMVIFPTVPLITRPLMTLGWTLSLGGGAMVTLQQAADTGGGLGAIFGSSLGRTLLLRLIPTLIAGVALIGLWRPRRLSAASRRRVLIVAGAGAAASMLADVLASHAAAQSPVVVNVGVQWLHLLSVGVWLGGLLTLLLTVRGMPSATKSVAIKRFSVLATVCLAVVAISGILRATVEVGTWGALTSTDFGRLIVAKVALLVILAILGGINHFRNVARASLSLRGLWRVGSLEMLAGATVIVVAAALVNVPPPISSAASTASSSLLASGSDFATTVKVQLSVSPGAAGFNTFTLHAADFDSGAGVTDASAELHFQFAGTSAVGASTLALSSRGNGDFAASGANLSLDGPWKITVLLNRGARSVEVPLQLTTRSVPPKIDISRQAGLPTLYTIHLNGGGTVQVYLDPDQPGAAEFHTTFLNAAGQGEAATSPTIVLTPPSGSSQLLAPRQLEPGHYVSDVTLPAGQSRFDIAAVAPSGDRLVTHVTLTPGG